LERFRVVDAHASGKHVHSSRAVIFDRVNRFGVGPHETLDPIAVFPEKTAFDVERGLREVSAHLSHIG
jgi:hypothetical protein